jgi:hypothetical protein
MRTALICLTVSFLATVGVYGQSPEEANDLQSRDDARLRRVGGQLLSSGHVSERPPFVTTFTLIGQQDPPQQSTTAKEPHARRGALIGLAAGTGGAALFWANSNCRYGSDGAAAMISFCMGSAQR